MVQANAEEASLVAFALQHMKAGAFKHICAQAAQHRVPDSASSKWLKPASPSTLYQALSTLLVRRRPEGMEGTRSCRAAAAAFAAVLKAFPQTLGVETWVHNHLGRGEPHLPDPLVWEMFGLLDEEPGRNGWPWPADPLLADMQPSAVLTPRTCLAAKQLQAPGTSDEDGGGGKGRGVEVGGAEEEDVYDSYMDLCRQLWEYPGAVRSCIRGASIVGFPRRLTTSFMYTHR